MKDTCIVLPVFNEDGKTVRRLVNELAALCKEAEIIVVNDASNHKYFCYPSAKIINCKTRQGYGGAIKTGIQATKRKYILTMDGDGQHKATDAWRLYQAKKLLPYCKMVIGQRRLETESFVRMVGRKILNLIASFFTRRYMLDLNSGMRIFERELAVNYFPILCNDFSFTTSLTISMMADNYWVEWFPITVLPRAKGHSKVRLFHHAWITLKYILWIGLALRTRGIRAWLRKVRRKSS